MDPSIDRSHPNQKRKRSFWFSKACALFRKGGTRNEYWYNLNVQFMFERERLQQLPRELTGEYQDSALGGPRIRYQFANHSPSLQRPRSPQLATTHTVCYYIVHQAVPDGSAKPHQAPIVYTLILRHRWHAHSLPSHTHAARLFQSREGIFGRPPTEYDQILRVRKAFEPYVNLWSTAKEWTTSYEAWTKGSFLAIDAEALEADVER